MPSGHVQLGAWNEAESDADMADDAPPRAMAPSPDDDEPTARARQNLRRIKTAVPAGRHSPHNQQICKATAASFAARSRPRNHWPKRRAPLPRRVMHERL